MQIWTIAVTVVIVDINAQQIKLVNGQRFLCHIPVCTNLWNMESDVSQTLEGPLELNVRRLSDLTDDGSLSMRRLHSQLSSTGQLK